MLPEIHHGPFIHIDSHYIFKKVANKIMYPSFFAFEACLDLSVSLSVECRGNYNMIVYFKTIITYFKINFSVSPT